MSEKSERWAAFVEAVESGRLSIDAETGALEYDGDIRSNSLTFNWCVAFETWDALMYWFPNLGESNQRGGGMGGIKNILAFIGAIWRGEVKVVDGELRAKDFRPDSPR